ncbi:receptor like protein 21 [Manihot esculenta]|uniref:receptor like protein 21 n=1 Tax=Manihot esculenta TaxID=3983 RepID=UPI001CC4DA5D|nr:receptor like protein 21 [Manihot esculenta]
MELANIAKCLLLGVVILWIQIHGNKCCFEEERLALLDFKAFVGSNGFDADHLLPSWIDDPTSNCCKWERVMCNSTIDHVTELSLNNTRQYDIGSDSFYYDENSWYVNLSMFQQLKELKTLNLSYNNFDCSIDDQGFERLKKLDINGNRFNKNILSSLGALTSLNTLTLSHMYDAMDSSFPIQDFQRLEELDLSGNRFNNSILLSLAALPSLNTLILNDNYMEGSFPNQGHVTELSLNNTRQYDMESYSFYYDENIWYVNLSMFQQLKELKTLNLSYNHFDCSIDDQGCERLLKVKKLEVLDLTSNRFSNIILSSLGALISLKTLILSSNRMEGSFPIQGFQKLEELDISLNSFNNSILSSLTVLPSLKTLILISNLMEGSFPNQGFERLKKLDISRNRFNKNILPSLRALISLNALILSGMYDAMDGSFPIQELKNSNNL